MLEHLFGSKTRVKLLTLFLQQPENGFFVRELTRRIDTQINAVRREIQNLLKIGLIVEGQSKTDNAPEEKRAGLKRKYYIANRQFPLFQEMHSLLTKAQVFLEQKMDARIRHLGDVQYLAFLGVFLGVRHQPVDLFIIGTINEKELKKLVAEFEQELGHEVNYTSMTVSEFTYRKEMADKFLNAILVAPKHVVVDALDDKMRVR